MEPFISKIDYEVPKYKNHLKKLKNFYKIKKKQELLILLKLKREIQ